MNSSERWEAMRAAIADQMGPGGPRPNQVFLLPDGCSPRDVKAAVFDNASTFDNVSIEFDKDGVEVLHPTASDPLCQREPRRLGWPKIGIDEGKDDRTVIVKHDAHGRVAEVNVTRNPNKSSRMATEFVRWREQRIAQLERERDAHMREDEDERRLRASVLGPRFVRLEEEQIKPDPDAFTPLGVSEFDAVFKRKTASEVLEEQREQRNRMDAILRGQQSFRSKLRDAYALDERERAEQEIASLRQQVAELETKFKHLMKVHMDLVCMTAMPPVIVTGPTKVAHGGTSMQDNTHPMQGWLNGIAPEMREWAESVAPETAKPTPAGLTMTAPMTHRFGGWGA